MSKMLTGTTPGYGSQEAAMHRAKGLEFDEVV